MPSLMETSKNESNESNDNSDNSHRSFRTNMNTIQLNKGRSDEFLNDGSLDETEIKESQPCDIQPNCINISERDSIEHEHCIEGSDNRQNSHNRVESTNNDNSINSYTNNNDINKESGGNNDNAIDASTHEHAPSDHKLDAGVSLESPDHHEDLNQRNEKITASNSLVDANEVQSSSYISQTTANEAIDDSSNSLNSPDFNALQQNDESIDHINAVGICVECEDTEQSAINQVISIEHDAKHSQPLHTDIKYTDITQETQDRDQHIYTSPTHTSLDGVNDESLNDRSNKSGTDTVSECISEDIQENIKRDCLKDGIDKVIEVNSKQDDNHMFENSNDTNDAMKVSNKVNMSMQGVSSLNGEVDLESNIQHLNSQNMNKSVDELIQEELKQENLESIRDQTNHQSSDTSAINPINDSNENQEKYIHTSTSTHPLPEVQETQSRTRTNSQHLRTHSHYLNPVSNIPEPTYPKSASHENLSQVAIDGQKHSKQIRRNFQHSHSRLETKKPNEDQYDFFFSIDPFISKIYDLCSLLENEFGDDISDEDLLSDEDEYPLFSSSQISTWIPSNDKRIRTLYELYETEKDYVKNLYILKEEYAAALKDTLTKDAFEFLFRHLDTIINVSEPFYLRMKETIEKRSSDSEDILGFMDIVMDVVPTWRVYADYINHYQDTIDFGKREREQNPSFCKVEATINQKIKDMGYRSTTLRSYSVQPVQRIPRIRLLLNDILRRTDKEHPEYDKIVMALDCVSELASYCNERKEEAENQKMLSSLQKRLGLKNLDVEDRKFLREVEVKLDSKTYTMYLFNDTIILSLKGDRKNIQIPLNDSLVRFCEVEEDNRIMKIEMKRTEMYIQMPSALMKDSWLTAIHKQQQLLVKGSETEEKLIYEGWLKKQGGEVKTMKRRYHVLTNQRMKYLDKRGGKLKGTYTIINAKVGLWTKKSNGFYIETEERSFCNQASSEEERQLWIDYLLAIPGVESGPPSSQEKKR